jgi:hypothetical protein
MRRSGTTDFSKLVARLVTQPEWPFISPRYTSCSAMIAMCVGESRYRAKSVAEELNFEIATSAQ